MRKLFTSLFAAVSAAVLGDSPVRVVDTLAELEQLYPNIEQPTAIVRGRLVRDDISPPRIYFWNPDSTSSTNDSIRPVRMGVGRWIYSTNATVLGSMTIGETNLQTALTLRGFISGTSGLKLERFGIGTNGISIAGGQIGLRQEDPATSRFIAVLNNDANNASLYLGGNAYTGFATGRVGNIYAPGVDLTTTNENKRGGDLYQGAGFGSGVGTPAAIRFAVPAPNTNSTTGGQSLLTMMELRHPATISATTNNTAFKLVYIKDITGTNYYTTLRMVVTNESGILRPIFIEE